MELREQIKREIDTFPEDYLPQLQQYIDSIKRKTQGKRKIRTLHLKGRYDNINIRRIAYE